MEKNEEQRKILSFLAAIMTFFIVVIGIFWGWKQILKIREQHTENQAEMQMTEKIGQNDEKEEISEPVTEETKTETKEIDELDQLADATIQKMSLEEKVAGLFMITPEALTHVSKVTEAGENTKTALEQYPVGGIIYFGQNIVDDTQVKKMLEQTVQYSKYPLFLGIDEEGGKVARIANSNLSVEKVEEAAAIGASGQTDKAYDSAATIAKYLKEYGFNVDFAPVADVLTNPDNQVIGTRAYSSDPKIVADMTQAAIKGFQENQISACMKHFPGLGDVSQDPHKGITITEKNLSDMRQMDFIPYRTGIETGTDMIMVSNMSAPEVNGDNTPCCMSSIIVNDVLRTELGYDGIVVTDAMNMDAIAKEYPSNQAAVSAIQAGVDIILMPDNFEEAYEGICNAVKEGTISEERIDTSLRRIYHIKLRK